MCTVDKLLSHLVKHPHKFLLCHGTGIFLSVFSVLFLFQQLCEMSWSAWFTSHPPMKYFTHKGRNVVANWQTFLLTPFNTAEEKHDWASCIVTGTVICFNGVYIVGFICLQLLYCCFQPCAKFSSLWAEHLSSPPTQNAPNRWIFCLSTVMLLTVVSHWSTKLNANQPKVFLNV